MQENIRESGRVKERNTVIDEITRNRRQKKALEALEKDNFQDDVPTSSLYVSDYKLQLNKKLQQRFSLVENTDPSDLNQSNSNVSLNSSQSGMSHQFISILNESDSAKKRKLKPESKLRFRKNFASLLEEEHALASDKRFNYFSINAGPSQFPARKFCSVCGFKSTYTCVQCGTKYCSTKCKDMHKDTRCLKWTA